MPLRNRSELATKFTYNPHNETWQTHKVRVVVDKKPFAQGGMRVCMKLYELEDSGDFVPCVAKVFKKETNSKEYFDEALTQMAAECFAQEFNKLKTKWKVSFLPVNVMMLNERNGQLCNVEPLLLGDYVKHNDNDGNVETSEQLPQAFTHFTWEASRHMLIVCDIQGLADCYTDPQIHSIDGQSFGRGNLGQHGILKFFKTHKCNRICQALKLPPTDRKIADRQIMDRFEVIKKKMQNLQEPKFDSEKFARGMAGAMEMVGSERQGRSSRNVSPLRDRSEGVDKAGIDDNGIRPFDRTSSAGQLSAGQRSEIAAVQYRLQQLQIMSAKGDRR
mmetsp:Transcript_1482/g.4465  ORF Transcript_1482/g.4465 Transcript_1482/m.4465 type:complete len:332 (-) Transcript_1482:1486-2481(-)